MQVSDKTTNDSDFSLLRTMPQIVRARDFRLYTKDGKRLIDLWQNGGAAVLGHTPPALLREIKNTASRGLYAPFPHFMEQRFIKALSKLLPGRSFRIFASPPNEFFSDNAVQEMFADGNAALWRPFLDFGLLANEKVPQNAPKFVIPVLPGIQGWRGGLPLGLCVLATLDGFEREDVPFPTRNDILPPVLLAAATRGVWDIIAASPQRANVQWPRINKALKNSQWQRKGIYIFPKINSPKEWAGLFHRSLEAGFLLPPILEHPIILPGILSPGEEAKLAELFA